ncbi:FAD-binding oxidoreductase [Nakamurella flava]|uniref:Delta(24)-sterol reductase n=1 Tax=Nakamurella flava TaxID=2576308 RepID=A0A4U6QIK1_9ACTN|nr:FAD-binding oxidoreductase [Nakamurella flava]TKV60200.1 FAD-binding oxidoreductase [Nakamurella flava]
MSPPSAPAQDHRQTVDRLRDSYAAIPPGTPVRLAKRTSNLFRSRARRAAPGLDVSGLTGVLRIDPAARTADVQGMCTYEDLVIATLPFGLAPLVVPQLRTITVGGAVTGGGIESSSFRSGLVHEGITELDILTGAGDVVTATPDNGHADLYRGFPVSYGTLGYATRLRVRLEPVQPFVALRNVRFGSTAAVQQALADITAERAFDGEPVHYCDGVVFGPDEQYLVLGRQTAEPGPVSDYTGRQVYYRSLAQRPTDRLTIGDYLWRWDTDWFWCSRAFGVQHPLVRPLWPRRWRRSSVYSRLIALDQRIGLSDGIERLHGRPPAERVVQDIEVPVDRTAAFLDWFLDTVPIAPVWLCPVRQNPPPAGPDGMTAPDPAWPLYPMPVGRTFVNVGFWSMVPGVPGQPDGVTNRAIEKRVSALDGHKSLYSQAYYDRDEFDRLYGGEHYRQLKRRYDPQSRLLDLYDKAVRRQ